MMWTIKSPNDTYVFKELMIARAHRVRTRALHRELYLAMMELPDTEDRAYHIDYLKRFILVEKERA